MKRLLIILVTTILIWGFAVQHLSALTFSGTPPQALNDPGGLNAAISSAWTTVLGDANNMVSKYEGQIKMAQAFGDATAYGSHAAELWGYQGYDNIAILGGLALGLQAPSLDANTLADTVKDIEKNGDAEIGMSLAGGINLGLHLGWFSSKAKNWYINVKFFMYDLAIPYAGYTFNFETMNFGVGLNYQLVKAKKFGKNLFLWRGVSIGTGLLVQKTSLDYTIKLDSLSENIAAYGVDLVLDPSVKLGLAMNTYTIPIELVSSIRILYFLNISLGAGIDFNFGTSDVIAESGGGVYLTNADPSWQVQPGKIIGDASTSDEPFVIRGRLMAGVGITIAPVVLLDVTATYYLTTGVGLNVSAGFIW